MRFAGYLSVGLAAAIAAAGPAGAQVPAGYFDNRSTPADLIRSYYNAIDRHEYARAWSYWAPSRQTQSYAAFVDGYAHTGTVAVVTGEASPDAGAGNLWFALPVALQAQQDDGTVKSFAGCYTFHLSQPSFQEPQFTPLQITGGRLTAVDGDYEKALPKTCPVQ